MSKQLEKEIDHQRYIKNNIWTALIVTIGGTLTLMLNPDNLFKIVFIIAGIFLSAVLFIGYFNKQDVISKLINKLEE